MALVLLFVAVVMSSPSPTLKTHLVTHFLLNRLGCSCSCTSSRCGATSSRSLSLVVVALASSDLVEEAVMCGIYGRLSRV